MHLNLINYTEMLALVVSIVYFNRIRSTHFVVLLPYLIILVCTEISIKYLAGRHQGNLSTYLYNIIIVVSFVTFYYLYYKYLRTPVLWKIVKTCIPLYLADALLIQFIAQSSNSLQTHNIIFGSLLLIIFIFFYFYEAFGSMDPVHLLAEPMFWLSLGLLLFCIGDFTYHVIQSYLVKKGVLEEEMRLFKLIINNLAIFEYICISIAIITCRKIRPGLRLQ